MTSDTDPSRLGDALGLEEINQTLSRARTVIRLFDACHSGRPVRTRGQERLVRPPLPEQLLRQPPGWLTLAAADLGTTAAELPELQHGLFTFHLLAGLRGAVGHRAGPFLLVDALSLAAFVAWKISDANIGQTPRFSADLVGSHVLTAVELLEEPVPFGNI